MSSDGRNVNLAAQYETVGVRLARFLRSYEADPHADADYLRAMRSFVKKYQAAPLFVIGLDAETIDSALDDLKAGGAGDVFWDFRLPYPTLVLDFPKGVDPRVPEDPCVVFIDTVGVGKFYVEVLRTSESYRMRVENMTEYERSILPRDPGLMSPVTGVGGAGIGEATAYILTVDQAGLGIRSRSVSAEYVTDCQAPVVPDWSVAGHCVFSTCVPSPACQKLTPLCQSVHDSATKVDAILCLVFNYINRPDRYIVKVTPEKTEREKRQEAKGLVPTFSKKELHIVLDHSQVREIVASAAVGGGHNPPLPHTRRGHWRELRAERFKVKGPVWVRPADINKGLRVVIKKSVYEVVS